jgi:hypothetical protein
MPSLAVSYGWFILAVPPTFFGHVFHIILVGPEEKMMRIYATRVVAVVANIHIIWDGAFMDFP